MALKVDNKVVHSSATEVLMQNVAGFSAGTNGGITLGSEMIQGDFEEFSQLGEIANIIGRRDVNSDAAATVKTLSSIDGNDVKVYFSTGAIEFKLVDAKRYGTDAMAFSQAIGEQIGIGITNYMLNKVITAGVGAIKNNATMVDGDGTATITAKLLNSSLKPMGDARDNVVAWVMNGSVFNDLVGDQLTTAVAGDVTANGVLYTESVGTLGRPAYVTDAVGLNILASDGTTPSYAVLGLTRGALKIIESESREFFSEIVGGQENLKYRIQAESSMLLKVNGYKYTATANPDDATLAGANWAVIATDVKNTAGVLINVKA